MRPALVTLVVVLMLTGCGDSETDSFTESVETYCPQFSELIELGDALQDSSDLQAAAQATREYARLGDQTADELDELNPPDDADTAWSRFVDALRSSAQAQGAVIDALENTDAKRLAGLEPEIARAQDEFAASLQGLESAGIAPECREPA